MKPVLLSSAIVATIVALLVGGVSMHLQGPDPLDPAPAEAKLLWIANDIGFFEGFSADGLFLFTLRNENQKTRLAVWDLRTGKRIRSHELPLANYEPGREFPRAFGAGRFFVCEANGTVVAIDLQSGQEWKSQLQPKEWDARESGNTPTTSFRMSPTGDYFCQLKGLIANVRETRTGEIVHQVGRIDPPGKFTVIGKVDGCNFNGDGKFFYYWGREENGCVLRVWDVVQKKVVTTIHNVWGQPVESPDGTILTIPVSDPPKDRHDYLDRVNSGTPGYLSIWSFSDLQQKGRIPWKRLELFSNRFEVRFSRDTSLIAAWESKLSEPEGIVHVVNAGSGELVGSFELSSMLFDGVFSNDNRKLAIMAGRRLHVIDLLAKRLLWQSEQRHDPDSFYFTSDSKQIVMPGSKGVVYLESTTGRITKTLVIKAGQQPIRLTSDGRHFKVEDSAATPQKQNAGLAENRLAVLHRIFELDSGHELLRAENPEYCRFHSPDKGKTVIQIANRPRELVWDMFCWQIPFSAGR